MSARGPASVLLLVIAQLVLLGPCSMANGEDLSPSRSTPTAKATFEAAVEVFKIDNTIWRSYKAASGQLYFHNSASGETTWSGPRKVTEQEESKLAAFLLFIMPFLSIFLMGGAYIGYLMAVYPERLKGPNKKAKHRQPGSKSDVQTKTGVAGRGHDRSKEPTQACSPGRSSRNGTPTKAQ